MEREGAKMIKTKKLLGIGPTSDGKNVSIQFLRSDAGNDELEFPVDQLDPLIALALQVDRQQTEKVEGKTAKQALLAQGVEVSADQTSERLLATFLVGTMRFSFALGKADAMTLARIINGKFPNAN
jgi:hypothetical protein